MDQSAIEFQQKYQRLASEYAKIRAQFGVLKTAFVDEQKKSEQLQRELSGRDELISQHKQQIESLGDTNADLKKLVESYKNDQKQKNVQSRGVSPDRTIAASVEAEINSVKKDLQSKMTECETVRAKLTDVEKQLAAANERLQGIRASVETGDNASRSHDKEFDRLNEILAIQETKQREKDRIIETLSRRYNRTKRQLDAIGHDWSITNSHPDKPMHSTSLALASRQADWRPTERTKRFELKSSISDALFVAALSTHVTVLSNALSSWLSIATSADLYTDMSTAGLIDSTSTFCLFRLLPALNTLRCALKSERTSVVSSASKNAPLVSMKLDGLLRCVDALITVCVRFAADLLESVSNPSGNSATDQQARSLSIGALVQAVADTSTLLRRYAKLHAQRVSLMRAALRAEPSSTTLSGSHGDKSSHGKCSQLEAEQLTVISCGNAFETLMAFLKSSTALSEELEEPDLISFDEPIVDVHAAANERVVPESSTAPHLLVDALQEHVRLLEAQLRECLRRLQLAEMQKRDATVATLLPNDVRNFYEAALQRLTKHVQTAHAKSVHFASELHATRAQLRFAASRLSTLTQELNLVRSSYEQQLAAMSDHLAELNSRITSQYDELASHRRGEPTVRR